MSQTLFCIFIIPSFPKKIERGLVLSKKKEEKENCFSIFPCIYRDTSVTQKKDIELALEITKKNPSRVSCNAKSELSISLDVRDIAMIVIDSKVYNKFSYSTIQKKIPNSHHIRRRETILNAT